MKRYIIPILLALALSPAIALAQTASGDPCQVMPKASASIAITSATTTSIVGIGTGQAIYICGVNLTIGASTTATFEYGTGATCGTGTNAISGAIGTGGAATIVTPTNSATQMVTPVSQRLCILSTGTGGIHGSIAYIQW